MPPGRKAGKEERRRTCRRLSTLLERRRHVGGLEE